MLSVVVHLGLMLSCARDLLISLVLTTAVRALMGGGVAAAAGEVAGVFSDLRALLCYVTSGGIWPGCGPAGRLVSATQCTSVLGGYVFSYGIWSQTATGLISSLHPVVVGMFSPVRLAACACLGQAVVLGVIFCAMANLTSHRYFSHGAFKASRRMRAAMAVVAAFSGQRGALWWASNHRLHHAHCGGPGDPQGDPRHAFGSWWYAHQGWLLDRRNFAVRFQAIPELAGQVELLAIEASRAFLSAAWLFILSRFTGWGGTDVLLGFFLSLQFEGLINSHCHSDHDLDHHGTISTSADCEEERKAIGSGERTGVVSTTKAGGAKTCGATDSLVVALLTGGEGWHRGHHESPRCAYHGWRSGEGAWYLDVVYATICGLERAGLVTEVRHHANKTNE